MSSKPLAGKGSNEPYLEILVQPQSKFRFRYKSEMTGKHGSLLGVCSSSTSTSTPSSCSSCTLSPPHFLPPDKNSAVIQNFQSNFSVNNLNQPGSSLSLRMGSSAQHLSSKVTHSASGISSGSIQNIPVPVRMGTSPTMSSNVSCTSCSSSGSVSVSQGICEKSLESTNTDFTTYGANSTPCNGSKIYPTVKLHNFNGEAIIRCSLVNEAPPHNPHPHILEMSRLLGSSTDSSSSDSTGFAKKLPIEIPVSSDTNHIVVFQGLNIIYTGKKEMRNVLADKLSQLQEGDKRKIPGKIEDQLDSWSSTVNLNTVCLYFEAFVQQQSQPLASESSAVDATPLSTTKSDNRNFSDRDSGKLVPICSAVVSKAIHHNKSTQTGDLRIVRIDKHCSSCLGGEEIFLLVEKIDKHNIQVKFYQENEKGVEIWKSYGKFSKLDVHHQYCIVFKTPPYRHADIDFEVDVCLQLERPSDGATSPPIPFKYKPIERLRKMPKRQTPRGGENSGGPSSSPGSSGTGRPPNSPGSGGQGSSSNNNSPQNNQGGNVPSCSQSVRQGSTQKFPCDTTQLNLGELGSVGTTNVAFTAALSVGEGLHSWAETSNFNVLLHKLRHLLCLVDENGDNALHAAISNKQKEPFLQILNIMTSSPDVSSALNEQNIHNETPISLAVCANCPEFVQELSERNADLTIPNLDGDNPIHLAVKTNNVPCLRALLRSNKINSVINRFNYSSMTPLHLSVANGFLEATDMICRAGASLTVQEGTFGRTPLHLAVEKGSITATMLLIQAAGESELAKIGNIQNYRGDTPLHVAASSGLVAICAILLYYGADPTVENYIKKEVGDSDLDEMNVGQTPIDAAANEEVLKTLCGKVESWEKTVRTCSQLLDTRLEKDKKGFSLDSLHIDSGIDIKDQATYSK